MKLVYFNDFRLGVLKGDSVVDVTSVVQNIPHTGPGDLMNGLIARFGDFRARLDKAAADGKGVPATQVKLRPPLPKPVNVDCMAVNYMEDGTRKAPGADQRLPQVAGLHRRARRDHGAARHCGHDIRRRSGARAGDRQAARAMCRLRRRWNTSSATSTSSTARRAASLPRGQYVLPDEVARDVRADRPLSRHGGRGEGSAEAAGEAVGERDAQAELQHRRHGAQDTALHRVDHVDTRSRARRHPRDRHQPPRACRRSRTATRWSSKSRAWAGSPSKCATI